MVHRLCQELLLILTTYPGLFALCQTPLGNTVLLQTDKLNKTPGNTKSCPQKGMNKYQTKSPQPKEGLGGKKNLNISVQIKERTRSLIWAHLQAENVNICILYVSLAIHLKRQQ